MVHSSLHQTAMNGQRHATALRIPQTFHFFSPKHFLSSTTGQVLVGPQCPYSVQTFPWASPRGHSLFQAQAEALEQLQQKTKSLHQACEECRAILLRTTGAGGPGFSLDICFDKSVGCLRCSVADKGVQAHTQVLSLPLFHPPSTQQPPQRPGQGFGVSFPAALCAIVNV